jgi:hypothetical protein
MYTFDAEYLLWFFANNRTPFPAGNAAPGVGNLVSLNDAEHAKSEPFSGGRFALGYWLVEDNPWFVGGIRDLGAEACFFFVGQRSLTLQNDEAPNLFRSFSDVNNSRESGFLVSAPGVATGGMTVIGKIDNLWGAEANLWKTLAYNYPGTIHTLSAMAGFRYLSAGYLAEIDSVSNFNPNLPSSSPFFPLAGDTLAIVDSFTTRNQFYGGQVGVVAQAQPVPGVVFQAGFKLALGVTAEDLFISGSQVRTGPGGLRQSYVGGVLALPSNIGHFERNKFAQVPELELKTAVRVTDHLFLKGGFSLLDWTRIIRAGEQIDREVNITQIPNFPLPSGTLPSSLTHPSVFFRQTDLLALSLSFGAEFRY